MAPSAKDRQKEKDETARRLAASAKKSTTYKDDNGEIKRTLHIEHNFVPKKENVNKEKARLLALLHDVPDVKVGLAEGLVLEAAFMRATLVELKRHIAQHGVVDMLTQGSYQILRESPAVKTYGVLIAKYTTVCAAIFRLLPKGYGEHDPDQDDDFDDFVSS